MRLTRTHVCRSARHKPAIDRRSGMPIEFNLALTFRDLDALQRHCGSCMAFVAAVKDLFESEHPELVARRPIDPAVDLPASVLMAIDDASPSTQHSALSTQHLAACPPLVLTGPGGGYVRAWPAETSKSDTQHSALSTQHFLMSDLLGGSVDAAIAEQCAV